MIEKLPGLGWLLVPGGGWASTARVEAEHCLLHPGSSHPPPAPGPWGGSFSALFCPNGTRLERDCMYLNCKFRGQTGKGTAGMSWPVGHSDKWVTMPSRISWARPPRGTRVGERR